MYFSHDGKYVTAGSENQCLYIWRSNPESNNLTVRKDRNSHYEAIKGMKNQDLRSSSPSPDISLVFQLPWKHTLKVCDFLSLAHNAAVTCSVFAPKPNLILEQLQLQHLESTALDPDVPGKNDDNMCDQTNQGSGNKVCTEQQNITAFFLLNVALNVDNLKVIEFSRLQVQRFPTHFQKVEFCIRRKRVHLQKKTAVVQQVCHPPPAML